MYPKIKTVNVDARIPVNTVTPKISGYVAGISMTTADILKCIIRKAMVDEILPNGKLLRLNMQNYYTDNRAGIETAVEAPMKTSTFMARTAMADTVSEPVPEVEVEEVAQVVEEVVEMVPETAVKETEETVEETKVEETVEETKVEETAKPVAAPTNNQQYSKKRNK